MTTATKQIDIIFNQKSAGKGALETQSALLRLEEQANHTREKMEKLASVGNKMALVGGAILAPFALAMKKYVDTAKETEPISKRLVALNKKWEESQVRLGRVTSEILLPALEKGADILDNILTFAEKNPGVVKAALTIGTTLVILGGLISTTAQLVSVVATIQGLAAAAGFGAVGGGTAIGGGVGLAAMIGAAFTAAAPFLAAAGIAALAIWAGAELGLLIANALLGTNYTIKDLGTMLSSQWRDSMEGWARFFEGLGNAISSAMLRLGEWLYNALKPLIDWFTGGGAKATGGYVSSGIYRMGERGKEFVLNNSTTRHAERAIGGRLTQGNVMSSMVNNLQVGNGMTIAQTRKMIKANEKAVMSSFVGLLNGA